MSEQDMAALNALLTETIANALQALQAGDVVRALDILKAAAGG